MPEWLLFLVAAIFAIFGVVNLLQGDLIWGLILLVVAALIGPGGYSITRGRGD